MTFKFDLDVHCAEKKLIGTFFFNFEKQFYLPICFNTKKEMVNGFAEIVAAF